MLFVLLIVTTIIFLVVPPLTTMYHKSELDNFFKILEADVLYSQNKSLEKSQYVHIYFNENYYTVSDSLSSDHEIVRKYPANFKAYFSNYVRVSFSANGSVMNPTTIVFDYHDDLYKIVFPFGKGRHYVKNG